MLLKMSVCRCVCEGTQRYDVLMMSWLVAVVPLPINDCSDVAAGQMRDILIYLKDRLLDSHLDSNLLVMKVRKGCCGKFV